MESVGSIAQVGGEVGHSASDITGPRATLPEALVPNTLQPRTPCLLARDEIGAFMRPLGRWASGYLRPSFSSTRPSEHWGYFEGHPRQYGGWRLQSPLSGATPNLGWE